MKFICILVVLLITGCASSRYDSGSEFIRSEEFKKRESLTESLFNSASLLKEEEIKKILNSKIQIPTKMRIGVVKLEHKVSYSTGWRYSSFDDVQHSFMINDQLIKNFFGEFKKSTKVKDLIVMPSFLFSGSPTLFTLREVAVRMQLDSLLIIRSESRSEMQYRPFIKDKVSAYTNIEALLFDVRTGIIPYTSIVSGKEVVLEKSADRNESDLMRRAALESEVLSLIDLAKGSVEFIEQL